MGSSVDALMSLVPKITPRDRLILSDLYEHNVMTTHHIHDLYFPGRSARVVRHCMRRLRGYGLAASFRPHARSGTNPGHWVLDRLGAELIAAQRGVEVQELAFRPDQALLLAHSYRLDHVLGLVEALVAFTKSARCTPSARLECWYSERESARRWGRHIRPDAYLQWDQDDTVLHAFLEYDTGTESLTQVQRKMDGYGRLARGSEVPSIVLFAVHSERREDHLAQKLASDVCDMVGVYVSTHARICRRGPAEAVWSAVGASGPPGRLRLVDIARRHPVPAQDEE